MKIRDIMVKPVITASKKATFRDVAELMIRNNIGSVVIVDDKNRVEGIITETDFIPKERDLPFSTFRLPVLFGGWSTLDNLEKVYHEAQNRSVEELMSPRVITISEDEDISALVGKMIRNEIKHVPVVQNNQLVGIVSRHDLLRMLMRKKRKRAIRKKSRK